MLAFALVVYLARRSGTRWQEPMATLGFCGMAAIVGARAWSLLEWWWLDRDIVWAWDPLVAAGYSTAGAFVGAGVALLLARAVFGRTSFARLLDLVVPSAFVALALTRLGCVIERCDPGRPSTLFFVTYPDGAQLQPFGAYISCGTLLVILASFGIKGPPGCRAVVIVLGYAAVRLVAEFARDAPTLIHAGHAVAVLVAAVAAAWWAIDGRESSAS